MTTHYVGHVKPFEVLNYIYDKEQRKIRVKINDQDTIFIIAMKQLFIRGSLCVKYMSRFIFSTLFNPFQSAIFPWNFLIKYWASF